MSTPAIRAKRQAPFITGQSPRFKLKLLHVQLTVHPVNPAG
jgi:hypothetical protein